MKDWLTRHERKIRWASLAAIAASLLVLGRALPLERGVRALRAWVEGLGAWGPPAYGLVYAVAVVAMVPGSLLTIAAGALFGLWVGVAVVSLAATAGASAAFLVARHLARERVARMAGRHPRFHAIDRAIEEEGGKVVALLRLSPLLPFSLSNYLYGLTGVRTGPYVLATWLGTLPGTVMYAYLGHVGSASAAGGRSTAEWVLLGVGLAATVAVTAYLTHVARRKMQERETMTTERDERANLPRGGEGQRGAPWRTAALGACALLLTALSASCLLRPGWLSSLAGGPPAVESRELYARRDGGPTLDHGRLDELLRAHVRDGGWVDYEGLWSEAAKLDEYLEELAAVELRRLGRDEVLALWINAYNACTLRLILDHYPVGSIRDIPEDQRWEGRTFLIAGRERTLWQMENDELRAAFVEPRLHFAINCASIGCPPLRHEAYVGARIDEMLEQQTLATHASDRWFRWEPAAGIARVTPVYDWYRGDFEQVAGDLVSFVSLYAPAVRAAREAGEPVRIELLDYDWSLNSVRNRPSAEGAGGAEAGS